MQLVKLYISVTRDLTFSALWELAVRKPRVLDLYNDCNNGACLDELW